MNYNWLAYLLHRQSQSTKQIMLLSTWRAGVKETEQGSLKCEKHSGEGCLHVAASWREALGRIRITEAEQVLRILAALGVS